MGERGPAPKPTVLKKLQGNPGKRKLNEDEPQPAAATRPPAAPRWLSAAAKKEWRRHAKPLWEAGLLTDADVDILTMYCETFASWLRAEAVVYEQGMLLRTAKGNRIQNPYLSIANRYKKDALILMRELGMTPSARSRISLPPAGDEEPTLAELLFRAVET